MRDMQAKTENEPVQPEGGGGAIRGLRPYLWRDIGWGLRGRVILAVACLLVAKGANVTVPLFYKGAVESLNVTAGLAVALPLALILGYGGARVLSLAFAEIRDAIFAKVGQSAVRSIALRVFRHMHALSLRFHLDRQTGGLSRSLERGTQGVENMLRFSLFMLVPTLFEIMVVFVMLWQLLDIWFAAVTLATVILYIAYTFTVSEWRLRLRRQMLDQDARANTRAVDSLLNYETVKYFANEEHEARRYDSALVAYQRAAVKSQESLSLLNVGQAFIIAIGLTGVMYMAAMGIVAGRMSLGDFVMVNTFLIQLYQPLNIFGMVYREMKQALVDMERMFALLAARPEVVDAPGARPLSVSGGTIVFEDVAFGYDARRPILTGLSFTVPAGRSVAIVGPSGAGKSTIARLLFRFYDTTGGRVTIDGQDIARVSQKSLRAAIGIVPQDTVLFNDTIFYNIQYGRPEAGVAEVEQAARLARIHDFIEGLPDGYQTMVGERGLKVSGGERQRIAIARTILKDPPILLFDEATSALDSRTEREIQDNLREIARGKTTLVIAHRLSTVVDADEIIVLEEGAVIERGRHGELLRRAGRYAEMWARQQEAADGEGEPMPAMSPAS